jgi:DNA-binding transcriptional LysR family regulator
MNGVNVKVVGTKIMVEADLLKAIAGGVGDIKPDHEVDHLAMGVSLAASTRGVALLSAYAQDVLPGSLVSVPCGGMYPRLIWLSVTAGRIRLRS